MAVPRITLNDGHTIPQLGFGVYQVDPSDAVETISEALNIGYRHIDTAEMYQNESQVGEAITQSGIPRDEIFITSKLNNGYHKPDDARKAFAETLEKLGTDYVDLFLIHWPMPGEYNGDFVQTWKVFEELQQQGQARSIGVSNFQVAHLQQLLDETTVVPAVNQIELHPYFTNDEVKQFGESHGIMTEAWSPIAQGGVLEDETITSIAKEYGKTPAQVVLRWHIQCGNIIFPKSSTPERIAENFAIFDFELSSDEVLAIGSLNKGESGRNGPNPDTFNMIPSN
ncbi:aldo/keto reductase [soil metagenome]